MDSVIHLGAEGTRDPDLDPGRILPIMACLTLILDVVIVVVDCAETHEIRMAQSKKGQGRNMPKSCTLMFIRELRKIEKDMIEELQKDRHEQGDFTKKKK